MKDLVGKTFGEWTVLKFDKFIQKIRVEYRYKLSSYKINLPYWICRCSCGRERSVAERNLTNTSHCGHRIINKTHGLSRTPEYIVWNSMQHRCKKDNIRCKDYFGRGIKVCQFLNESVINFLSIIISSYSR